VTLNAAGRGHTGAINAEEYWPDMEGLDFRDTVTDFTLPGGTFFDCATVHLLTTATLDRLHQLCTLKAVLKFRGSGPTLS
jgi:uncharacterized protein